MKKKIATVLAMFLLVTVLTGCGASEKEKEQEKTKKQAENFLNTDKNKKQ